MLKALIVDDEKLVRKGIIGLVDWQKYGMMVVGEAENGEEALSFLDKNDVQFLFSDLSMPGISGIEFLSRVREKFPAINIVVLTMLQDFDVLQQAMRLGVVDYITKSQIENENLDAIMENIFKQTELRNTSASLEISSSYQYDSCVFAYGFGNDIDDEMLRLEMSKSFIKLFDGLWFLQLPPPVGFSPTSLSSELVFVQVDNVRGIAVNELIDLFNRKITVDIFYAFKLGCNSYRFGADSDSHCLISKEKLLSDFKNLPLMLNQHTYEQKIAELVSLQMPNDELSMFCYQLYVEWAKLTECSIVEYFDNTSAFCKWVDWEEWINKNRCLLKEKMADNIDRQMNELVIQNALTYIRENFRSDIKLDDLLRLTNMSKSHFCKQFKKVTGMTFINYIKQCRILLAQEYLSDTDQSISWISQEVGYPNEKYFRRVFFELVNKTPTSYRKSLK